VICIKFKEIVSIWYFREVESISETNKSNECISYTREAKSISKSNSYTREAKSISYIRAFLRFRIELKVRAKVELIKETDISIIKRDIKRAKFRIRFKIKVIINV